MRLKILQHVPFEGPAAIAEWADSRGHDQSVIRLDRGEPVPEPDPEGGLVVMGGPMSVNDTDRFAWIEPERRLIRAMIDRGRPVLGICLGAQFIAAACGANVYPGPEKEIGWFPVRRVHDDGFGRHLPETFTPLHWHGETFDLPDGATRLAETEAAANQAFQVGPHALGLQFHLEATPDSVRELVEHAGHEIGDGRFEQDPGRITDCEADSRAVQPILFDLLDDLFGA